MEPYQYGEADFEWALGLNRFSLKTIGVWPEDTGNPLWNDLHVAGLVLFLMFGILIPQIYALVKVIDELPLVADNLMTYVAYAVSATKIILLWHHRKRLLYVMSSIKYDCYKYKDDWERDIMLTFAKRGRLITICGLALVLSSVISMLFGPFIGMHFRVINNITDRNGRYLPAQTYYPYDFTKTPYFEMTYATQMICTAVAGTSFTSCVTFFSALVLHNCAQLSILGIKINNIVTVNTEKSTIGQKSVFKQSLRDIVNTHTHIIRIINTIEISFRNLILAQIVALTLELCCMGFQILNAIDNPDKSLDGTQLLALFLAFLTTLMHTFVYCSAGETLTFHCEDLHRKIYETNWYLWDAKSAMALLLIMMRSKDPLCLTMGKFMDINLQSFTKILKTAAGYISMLLAIKEK